MMASDTGLIHFDDVRAVRVTASARKAWASPPDDTVQEERLWAAANAIEGLLGCIRRTVDYARDARYRPGHPDNQVVHFRLADSRPRSEALRPDLHGAFEHYVASRDVTEWASMAKLKAGRLLRRVPDARLQFWGRHGLHLGQSVSRLYHDGRLASIGGGADEVMLSIIAGHMGSAAAA